jgi:hypothetical protein
MGTFQAGRDLQVHPMGSTFGYGGIMVVIEWSYNGDISMIYQ